MTNTPLEAPPPRNRPILVGTGIIMAIAGVGIALASRTVWLASIRPTIFVTGMAVSLAVVAVLVWRLAAARFTRTIRNVHLMLLFAWLASLAAFIGTEMQFRDRRGSVLQAPPPDLARLGRHVMVGYRNIEELRRLVRLGAVGGVFVTARNAADKSVAQIANEIGGLQALARQNGHPPLIVATDQEGGMVSRLSPPLPKPKMLAELARASGRPDERRKHIEEYGFDVGRHLAQVGVTMNFAPVTDLDFGIRDPTDQLSRISERAIGSDPALVGEVAGAYCRGLNAAGVLCTLKHFPGLGRVRGDTHIMSASLAAPLATLEATDWQPFRRVLKSGGAAVMMAHVIVNAIDAERPASASRGTIDGILRKAWKFDGIVVTDDLTMIAASGRPGGIGAAGVDALTAGADLLLVAYDTDQVYALLDSLMAAWRDGKISDDGLAKSARRLARRAIAAPHARTH
ncbi:MAG: glycoside hydrolase family 3 N-terminal domain-containing protein [Hyphomicrobiaceae bacterium]